MSKSTKITWWLGWRYYRSPIIQGFAIFLAFVGYQHDTLRWVWAIAGYFFGLLGVTLASWENQLMHSEQTKCPSCHGSGWITHE